MQNRITLNLSSPTNISMHHGRVISFLKLELTGIGKIKSCVLRFFNSDDILLSDVAIVKLTRPEFSMSQVLIPQVHGLLLMEYNYCQIGNISGFIYPEDKVTLTLTELSVAVSR